MAKNSKEFEVYPKGRAFRDTVFHTASPVAIEELSGAARLKVLKARYSHGIQIITNAPEASAPRGESTHLANLKNIPPSVVKRIHPNKEEAWLLTTLRRIPEQDVNAEDVAEVMDITAKRVYHLKHQIEIKWRRAEDRAHVMLAAPSR